MIVYNAACSITMVIVAVCFGVSAVKHVSFAEMTKRVQDFQCGKPRPKSFKIGELYPDIPESGVSPTRIVLYRCEDSLGCCDAGQKCTAQESEPVSIELSLFQASNHELITREAIDHTLCHCT
ncbi:hypothetical protein Trydic_g16037 [Trypoxylus dichotomus]